MYRINDELVILISERLNIQCDGNIQVLLTFGFCLKEYSVEIYEWSGKAWEPYVTDDVQVQFYMMSPYVLKTLSTNNKV